MVPQTDNAALLFRAIVLSPVKFRLLLLSRLPMALLAGLRVTAVTPEYASARVPYSYLNKNPFRSIYFACLSMAAELSTGVLCMMQVYKSVPTISMLVVHMEANFTRKAIGKITFNCLDGKAIAEAVKRAKTTGEGTKVITSSIGINESGEQVASFCFTWSFKAKR